MHGGGVKRLIDITIFVILTVCLLDRFVHTACSHRMNFFDFYKYDKNTVDVLCVGSSHAYCSINTVQMYDDYGIAACNLGDGAQAVWYSYYYIVEALKTQKPLVVILDVYTAKEENDSYFDYNNAQMNLINLKPSFNKWRALRTAEIGGISEQAKVFWEFPVTHSRYGELQRQDFDLKWNKNVFFSGYQYDTKIVPYELEKIRDVKEVKEIVPITNKAEEYIRKTIELCKKENIDVILVNAPWPDITDEVQKKYNYIQKIAAEYEVPFLNGCLYNKEIGMDYTVDSMGNGGHLNHAGATKYTKWLVEFMQEHYKLPDRRGDQQYDVWRRESDKLKAVIQRNGIQKINTLDEYLHTIQQTENLKYVVSLNGDFSKGEESAEMEFLKAQEINICQGGTYVMDGSRQSFSSNGESEYRYYRYFGDSVLYVYNENNNHVVLWDGINYTVVKNGINFFVYDELLDEVISVVGFDADNNYGIIRWK